MTQSVQMSSYPFGAIEEETKSMLHGDKSARNSMVHSSRDTDSDASFVSATDSPDDLLRQVAQQKLRAKK